MMDWINGDPFVFILLQDLQGINTSSKLSFPDRILTNETSFNMEHGMNA